MKLELLANGEDAMLGVATGNQPQFDNACRASLVSAGACSDLYTTL